jgi:hypothetical protein
MPSDEILSSAGINHADALAMAEKFAKKSSGSPNPNPNPDPGPAPTGTNTLREKIATVAGGIADMINPIVEAANGKKKEEKISIFDSLRKKFTK